MFRVPVAKLIGCFSAQVTDVMMESRHFLTEISQSVVAKLKRNASDESALGASQQHSVESVRAFSNTAS